MLDTDMVKKLLTEELKDYIEGQVEVRLGGGRRWKLVVAWEEKPFYKKRHLSFKNLKACPNNPFRYTLYKC